MNDTHIHAPGEIVELVVYKDQTNFTVYLGVILEFQWAMAKDGTSSFTLEGFYAGLNPIKYTFVDGQPGVLTHAEGPVKYPLKGSTRQRWCVIKRRPKATGTYVTYGTEGNIPYTVAIISAAEIKKKLTSTGLQKFKERPTKQLFCKFSKDNLMVNEETFKEFNDKIKEMNVVLIPISKFYNEQHKKDVMEAATFLNRG